MRALPITDAAAARPGTPRVVVNAVLFEVGWFACVLGAAHGHATAGVALAGAAVALHLAWSAKPLNDATLIAAALAIGVVWDSAMAALGWIVYAAPGPWRPLAPAWIVALWALLATTLGVSLRGLQTRPFAAAALGAAAGPLSYVAAGRLGAAQLVHPLPTLAVLSLGWAAVTPLLLVLARRLEGARGA